MATGTTAPPPKIGQCDLLYSAASVATVILLTTNGEEKFPLAADKMEGPSTSLTFLGIQLDTVAMQASLPINKLTRLRQELAEWDNKESCTRKQLQHLIGVLQFAIKVVPQGRPFVRRLIDLLSVTKESYHHIRLNKESWSDLAWWKTYVNAWNGISFLQLTHQLVPSVNVFTDASGSFGRGAIWGTLWVQGQWPSDWLHVNIMVKKLVPVVLAGAIWGQQWSGQHVQFHIDNMSVVECLRKGSSKEPSGIVMHLLRCLSFVSAYFGFTTSACHVAGVNNVLADDISRNHLSDLSSQVPGIQPLPTPIPACLWSLLVGERPDWTSNRWRQLFANSMDKA